MFHCIGCNNSIPWDGKCVMCYTCPCGATVFYRGNELIVPVSLKRYLFLSRTQKLQPRHIDYYVGRSSFTSERKEQFIKELEGYGLTWSKDCPECLKVDQERATREVERILGRE